LDGSKMRKSCLIMSHVVKKRGWLPEVF
jgi:hypothetical protein